MWNKASIYPITAMFLIAFAPLSPAQPGKNKGQQSGGQQSANSQGGGNQGGGQQGGGSSPSPGITWTRDTWDALTKVPSSSVSKFSPLYTLCYELQATIGSLSTPPFALQPMNSFAGFADPSARCIRPPSDGHPIVMRGRLVVAIDMRRVPIDRLRSMTLNVTTTQGSAISTNPLRPSLSASSGASTGGGGGGGAGGAGETHTPVWGRVYYLIWPQELGGDVIPTVSVNIVYTPPMPGIPWQMNTVYPEGSVITPGSNNGRYYTARVGGISGNVSPKFNDESVKEGQFKDGGVIWIDSGATAPLGAPTPPTGTTTPPVVEAWQANRPYAAGTTIFYAPLGRYYTAATAGTSSSSQVPAFAVKTFADKPPLVWADSGMSAPSGGTGPANAAWKPNHPYNAGGVIFDVVANRYYTAVFGGISDPATKPTFAPAITNDQPPLVWTDIGMALPPAPQLQIPTWVANHAYQTGDVILNPLRGHYFTAIQGGTSGATPPSLQANKQVTVKDTKPTRQVQETLKDADGTTYRAFWREVGPAASEEAQQACPGKVGVWQPGHAYQNGACVAPVDGSSYFQLQQIPKDLSVISGARSPDFPDVTALQNLDTILWEDSGFTPPPLVTSGEPADQTITLTYSIPQVHSKYYFNLSSGVVISSIRSGSYGWETLSVPSGSGPNAIPGQYYPIQTGSNLVIDPVLFFTAYIWPMDAERTHRWADLRPALTFGLSLSNPSSHFYLGGSSEIVRNVQFVYGLALAEVPRLAPGVGVSASNSSAPGTVQKFSTGVYGGLSFNISGFLQTLFGGGKASQ